ncbi:hypothetical protein QMT40_002101 [Parvibaculaceae bacterium PLY_AMNH_Bact1]|nr:hypothetical protein QMT40_002101 [Parvibaculaceae bacterium PLY_AMNH_Bact1]
MSTLRIPSVFFAALCFTASITPASANTTLESFAGRWVNTTNAYETGRDCGIGTPVEGLELEITIGDNPEVKIVQIANGQTMEFKIPISETFNTEVETDRFPNYPHAISVQAAGAPTVLVDGTVMPNDGEDLTSLVLHQRDLRSEYAFPALGINRGMQTQIVRIEGYHQSGRTAFYFKNLMRCELIDLR